MGRRAKSLAQYDACIQLTLGDRVDSARGPIAITGMGCRYAAGIDSPEALWNFLIDGREVVRAAPSAGVRANAERLIGWLHIEASPSRTWAAPWPAPGLPPLPPAGPRSRGRGQPGELIGGLRDLRVSLVAEPRDPVWVFSGHGAQWRGMGRGMFADEPAVRRGHRQVGGGPHRGDRVHAPRDPRLWRPVGG